MKAMPTLEGGLRIDAEVPNDWIVLQAIVQDARSGGVDLASRMGDLIGEDAGSEDWEEYVVPDLREVFQDQLHEISATLESAMAASNGGAGSLWIKADHGFIWYGALNQARLAIEERYQFGARDEFDETGLTPVRRSAFLRSQFYLAIQSMLLDHVMK